MNDILDVVTSGVSRQIHSPPLPLCFKPSKGIDYSNSLFPINSINQHPSQKPLKPLVCLSFQNRLAEASRASKRLVYSSVNRLLSNFAHRWTEFAADIDSWSHFCLENILHRESPNGIRSTSLLFSLYFFFFFYFFCQAKIPPSELQHKYCRIPCPFLGLENKGLFGQSMRKPLPPKISVPRKYSTYPFPCKISNLNRNIAAFLLSSELRNQMIIEWQMYSLQVSHIFKDFERLFKDSVWKEIEDDFDRIPKKIV